MDAVLAMPPLSQRDALWTGAVPCGACVVAWMLWRCCARRRPMRSGTIEVEKKVLVDSGFRSRLVRAGARPLGRKRIVDVYYDTPDWNLCLEDAWLRMRNADGLVKWELKVGPGLGAHDGKAAKYREFSGLREVEEEVLKRFAEVDGVASISNLQERNLLTVLCRIATTRESYELGPTIQVDVDTTDDGHVVAELEVLAEDEGVGAAVLAIDAACQRIGIDPNAPPAPGKMDMALRAQQPALLEMIKRRTSGRPL